MKRILLSLAVVLAMLAVPAVAFADHVYQTRHCSQCREVSQPVSVYVQPVYECRTVLVGYDGCGCPIYRTQNVMVRQGYWTTQYVRSYVCPVDYDNQSYRPSTPGTVQVGARPGTVRVRVAYPRTYQPGRTYRPYRSGCGG